MREGHEVVGVIDEWLKRPTLIDFLGGGLQAIIGTTSRAQDVLTDNLAGCKVYHVACTVLQVMARRHVVRRGESPWKSAHAGREPKARTSRTSGDAHAYQCCLYSLLVIHPMPLLTAWTKESCLEAPRSKNRSIQQTFKTFTPSSASPYPPHLRPLQLRGSYHASC